MKFKYKDKEYYINYKLAQQLDSFVYNLKDDWDFVIVITGDRMVRVGKSILAQIVAVYLAARILEYLKVDINYDLKDIYFDSETMSSEAQKKQKYSINIYDEGREGLASNKAMTTVSKDIIDFFNECGQLNHIMIVVLPDFFGLNEEIAVARSECLINVYRKSEKKLVDMYKTGEKIPIVKFKRGQFEFFSRYNKSALYDKFKKGRRKYYGMQKHDFVGDFTNQYTVDEEGYRKKKADALSRFKQKNNVEKKSKSDIIRDKEIMKLHKQGLIGEKISEALKKEYDFSISKATVNKIIARTKAKEEAKFENFDISET